MGIQINGTTDTISAVDGTLDINQHTTFGGNVTIGGTITYEDVTSIDSVGIITAKNAIHVNSASPYVKLTDTDNDGVVDIKNIGGVGVVTTTSDVKFDTAGSERLRIASDGKVYFGDFASVGSKAYIFKETSGDYKFNIFASSSTSANRIITFNSRSDVEALRIDASGRIGINNSAPLYPMHFKNAMGSSPSWIHMEVTGSNTTGGGGGIAFDTSASNSSSNNGLFLATISGERSASANGSNTLVFKTSKANTNGDGSIDSGPKTQMVITEDGNIGIGENSPANLLHVKVSDTGVAPHGSAQIVLERSGTNYLQFLTAADGTSGLLFGDANDNDVSKIVYDHNVTELQFLTETSQRMKITGGGVVQIGGNIANNGDLDTSNTKLTIKQSANSREDGIYIERSGERRGWYQYVGGGLSSDDALCFDTNQLGTDTSVLALDRSGNVKIAGYLGVNQTSPSTRLDVKQDNGVAYNGNAQSIAYNAARFHNTSGHTSGGTYTGFQFNISGDSQNRICSMGMITEASNSKLSSLVFHTDDGSNRTEKLRIDSNGYVGIKLTDPHLYYAKDLVVKSIDQGGITIRSTGTSDTQYLMFADGTSGNERYRGYIGYQHNTGSGGGEHMQLAASGTMMLRVDSDGLKFNSDTAAANALDDYEEGTWTPQMQDENGSNYVIVVDSATYTKIGRQVILQYQIKRNESGSKTGILRMTNLPFAPTVGAQTGSWWADHSSPSAGLGDIVGGLHSIGTTGGGRVYFVKPTDKSGVGQASTRYLEHGQWTDGRWMYGQFLYIAST